MVTPLDSINSFGKYLTPKSAISVLKNGTLRWSRPGLFNDPFDSSSFPSFSPPFETLYEPSIQEFRRVLRNEVTSLSLANPTSKLISMMRLGLEQGLATIEEYEQHLSELILEFMGTGDAFAERFHNDVAAHLEDLKILCLTKNFESEQMWAHYAEDFKGALLLFQPATPESLFTRAEEVRYSDDPYFIFDADEFAKLITGQISMSDREYTSRSVRKIILSKKLGWRYEAEWRINFGSGRAPQDQIEYLPFDASDLFAVIFGLRSTPDFVAESCELARARNGDVRLFESVRQLKANRIEYRAL